MKKIEAFVRPEKISDVQKLLAKNGHRSVIQYEIWYRGTENEIDHHTGNSSHHLYDFMPKVKVELVVKDDETRSVIDTLCEAAGTDHTGDGKIFVVPVETAIRIQTKETGDTVV
jgi:nitrogen regulatory protein P-II 1